MATMTTAAAQQITWTSGNVQAIDTPSQWPLTEGTLGLVRADQDRDVRSIEQLAQRLGCEIEIVRFVGFILITVLNPISN